ncbi:DUF317 domain-containing protein [Streptomyces sp. NPDC050844]|uniref:DUF317 domain-containing protein n=1 Tax=Streptomyces sp. NPDC050844 TaxID=3155790 RepID=UPI00340BB100
MTDHAPTAPYLIAPRYLAGPDTSLAVAIGDRLRAAGWRSDAYRGAVVYARREAGGLLEAVHIPNGAGGGGKCPAAGWEFTARPGPGTPSTWSVRFTPATPPELPAALASALTEEAADSGPGAKPHYLRPPLPPAQATMPLDAAGWMRDIGTAESAWYAPGQQAVVVTPVTADEHGDDGASWMLAARRATDLQVLWLALAHPATPTHLVRALCAEISDPAPVPRHRLPDPEVGELTLTQL